MKKTHKKIFSVFGLLAVVAITVFAASLPAPETQAVNTVTDTITVTVINENVTVSIDQPEKGSVFVDSNQNIQFTAHNAKDVTMLAEYTDKDGVTTTGLNFGEWNTNFAATYTGSANLAAKIAELGLGDGHGYGEYKITVIATGSGEDNTYEDVITFSYYPVTATAEENDDYNVNVDLNYNKSNPDIDKIVIEVYDENGNPINLSGFSPITVHPTTGNVILPFSEYGMDSGKYVIHVSAYGADGKLYLDYLVPINYTSKDEGVSPTGIPDTGGLLQNTNISSTDYLVTGLIIFGIIAIGGITYIVKNDKKRKATTSSRRK